MIINRLPVSCTSNQAYDQRCQNDAGKNDGHSQSFPSNETQPEKLY